MNTGKSQQWIADRCDTGQSHISYLYRGLRRCPNWELGNAIIALHKEVCWSSSPERKAA